MALRTVVYLRRSSDRDEKQLESIPRQKLEIVSFLDRFNKFETDPKKRLNCMLEKGVDFFHENISGKKMNRPEFEKMLAKIKKKKFDVLLCPELSRLSRNPVDNGRIVALLDPYAKNSEATYIQEVRTIDKSYKNNPTDKFTLSLFLTIAKYENDQRGENVKSSKRRDRVAGKTTFRAPLGYRNVGDQKGQKSVDKDENWDDVRKLWEMLISGSYTVKDIHNRAVGEMGLTYKNKKGVHKVPVETTLRAMFRNRYYTGRLEVKEENGKVEWKVSKHPAMVSDSEFQEAQMVLMRMGYKHSKIDKAVDIGKLLSKIAISGLYTVVNKDGEVVPASIMYTDRLRYRCLHCRAQFYAPKKECKQCGVAVTKATNVFEDKRFSHLAPKGDGSKKKRKKNSIGLDLVLECVEEEFSNLEVPQELFNLLRRRLYAEWLEGNESIRKRKAQLNKRILKLEDERTQRMREYYDEVQDTEKKRLSEVLDKIEDDLNELEEQRTELREKHEENFEEAWQSLQVLRDLPEVLTPYGEFEPKKRIILAVVSNLVFYEDRVELIWKKPFDLLVKSHIDKGGAGPSNCKLSVKNSVGSP